MDLKKLKLESEIYSTSIEKIINIIDDYINLYKEYDSLYTDKWNNWITYSRKQFKEIYSALDFSLDSTKKNFDLGYEKSRTIYETAKYNTLEFELMIGLDNDLYETIIFLQTEPKSDDKNIY